MDTVSRTELPPGDIRKQVVEYLIASGHFCQDSGRSRESAEKTAEQVRLIRVQGTSMLPALSPGDIIVALPLPGRPPVSGEVVLLQRGPKAVVVHRVIRQDPSTGFIQTRGDSRLFNDSPVLWRNCAGLVLGKVENCRIVDIPQRPGTIKKALTVVYIFLRRIIGVPGRFFIRPN